MAVKAMKRIILLSIVATSFASETVGPVTDTTGNTESTEAVCSPPSCTPSFRGERCFLAYDPTNCTPPRCVCGGPEVVLVQCPEDTCAPGATLYRAPRYFACPKCVCLPKPCAKCDPNNTTIPNFPTCTCPTCQCIDGQCVNNTSTTDSIPELITYSTSP